MLKFLSLKLLKDKHLSYKSLCAPEPFNITQQIFESLEDSRSSITLILKNVLITTIKLGYL